jgi:hypothetical protein
MTCISAMTSRERLQALMNFQAVDRLPILEWASWWDLTIRRWEGEGLPAGLDRQGIYRYFGMDVNYQDWIAPHKWRCPQPALHGAPVVQTADEYEALRPLLYPKTGPLIDVARWEDWARRQRKDGDILWFTLEGFFWYPRTLMGIEPHLYAFYDQPELMHRMNEDLVAFNLRVIDEICAICRPDFMTFAEDLSYNNGPMLSEEQFDEFLLPYYQHVVPRLKGYGVRVIVDSDGNITKPAPWFDRAGIEGILPLERQAGVDLNILRERHPKQLYVGAFDKMVMHHGEAALRAEFERLMPVARQGGFVISVDHQTPPAVSLEDYRLFLRLFNEYALLR